MSRRRPDKGKSYTEKALETSRVLGDLGFKQRLPNLKEFISCRAPSCGKRIQREFSRHGYCMACIDKAGAYKNETERGKKIADESRHFYDNDSEFGAF